MSRRSIDLGKIMVTLAEGVWNARTSYEVLTAVYHNGDGYISRRDNIGVEPGTDDSVWYRIVKQGTIPNITFDEDGNMYADDVLITTVFADVIERSREAVENVEQWSQVGDTMVEEEMRRRHQEDERIAAENERVLNERNRRTAEENRARNESSRESNENSRELAESARETRFEEAMRQAASTMRKGDPGKSAYEVAVDNGFEGTEMEWLASLTGSAGDSAYAIAVQQGFVGTEDQWLASLVGPQGKSAYQVAVDNGFEGTISEWLLSLKGAQGDPGRGITSVVQTTSSSESEGDNVITVTLSDGTTATFTVKNGKRGLQGIPGAANVKYKQVEALPTASAATMDFIYLVESATPNVYDMSYTEEDGGAYSWKSLGTTAIQLSDYASKSEFNQLDQKVNVVDMASVPYRQGVGIINSSGNNTTSANWRKYFIENLGYSHITLTHYGSTSYYAIAFYSSMEVAAANLMEGSVMGKNYTQTYDADVPAGCKLIVVTNDYAHRSAGPVVKLTIANADASFSGGPIVRKDVSQKELKDEGLTRFANRTAVTLADVKVTGKYIAASGNATSSTKYDYYAIPLTGKEYALQCLVDAENAGNCAIAFYKDTAPASGQLIQSYPMVVGETWFTVPVPKGAILACVSNMNTACTPEIYLYSTNVFDHYLESKFERFPRYYHFAAAGFLKDGNGNGRNVIPSESLDDVAVASRLGFAMIEANVKTTSDGKYIVIHGGDAGKFGTEVNAEAQDLVIADYTLAYIKTNVRYASAVAKYQTTIPTLEEFLHTCRRYGLGAFVGSSAKSAIQLSQQIMGSDLVVYNPPADVRDYYDGYCYNWHNNTGMTKDKLIAEALSFGKPYISGLGPTAVEYLESRSEMTDFIAEMHALGMLVSVAYLTEAQIDYYFAQGVDILGSARQVNAFEPNLDNVDINDDPTIFETDGTLSDGILTLADGETLAYTGSKVSLGKAMLSLRFSGSLVINFGSAGAREAKTSDGNEDIVLSDYILQGMTSLTLTSVGATTITAMHYKTSRC